MKLLFLLTFLLLSTILHPSTAQSQDQPAYKNASLPVDERVEDLLSRMTVEEKIGQMTQLNITMINTTEQQRDVVLDPKKAMDLILNHHVGSFLNGEAVPAETWYEYMNELTRIAVDSTRLGIPIIYGIDHIHGASYLQGATLFPQGINLGATFNPEHSYNTGYVTAMESADLGHHWNFAPVLDLGNEQIWPRFWETYGEDPYMASVMGAAYVRGLQENEAVAPYKVAATAKHFLGYSTPRSGWDRTPVQMSMQAIHEFHRPSFQAAVDAGVKTVMVNSGEINGVPVHASYELLTELLREQMGFEGVIVTDWADIDKLVNFHRVSEDFTEATYLSVMAGIDMSMTPTDLRFNESMMELVESGRMSEERIDESVRRILKLKFDLGLFEHPFPRNDRFERIGSEEHTASNLKAAEESLVLLKNEGSVLPLSAPARIVLAGPTADNKRNLSGGWTIAWQGGEEERYPEDMHTIYTALQDEFPDAEIELVIDIPHDAGDEEKKAWLEDAGAADMIVYAGGEEPYTEFVGNIKDLALPQNQLDDLQFLAGADAPLTLILVQGRPRLVTSVYPQLDAFVHAGLPGFEGGEAIARLISGAFNPSGKLPFSYPQHTRHYLNYNHKSSEVYFFNPNEANHIAQGSSNTSLFTFGDGMSYTTFEYSDLALDRAETGSDGSVTASVTVTNTGNRAGMESVLWFTRDMVGSITRPVKELKHFEKISLEPGESQVVIFEIVPSTHLVFPNERGEKLLEPGAFQLFVGGLEAGFQLTD